MRNRADYSLVSDVVVGFAIVTLVVATGYLTGRSKILGPTALDVLSKAAFFVFSPALLFIVLGDADIRVLFSALLPVSALAATLALVLYVLIARLSKVRGSGRLTVGGLAASYVNSNNIGLPLAAYILGDPALAAPVLLFQLIVMSPIALTILDVSHQGSLSIRRILSGPIRNPLIIGSMLGVLVSWSQITLPDIVHEPLELLGQAAVPTLLFALGLSLASQRLWEAQEYRVEITVAAIIKLTVMPLIAWLLGVFVFALETHPLFTVVILAALPSAQNVFNYSQRYGVATPLARDSVVLTTLVSLPILMGLAFLLAPV
ncbi:AEC family transporter [Pontimonas sp.]|nr:AEC family transporter [Pontimonas sp.]MDA8887124.1 AEC family transporter [Pontimonas sp.]